MSRTNNHRSAFFSNASNLSIENSHINNANTIQYSYEVSGPKGPLELLLKNCALEATHESNTAAYAPKCKKGTRQEIIGDIMKWVSEDNTSKPVLWFSGPAGGGKTCIQREIARIAQERGDLAASYFFSTRVPNLDDEQPFIATIVRQLVNTVPGLLPHVERCIKKRPDIFHCALELQVEMLILKPLKSIVANADKTLPRILLIDGSDECREVKQRQHLLEVLYKLVSNPDFPFRVILASRPEWDIRTAFGSEPYLSVTTTLRLANYEGDEDIRYYLCDEFAKIRSQHPSHSSIPPDWPREEDIETLVSKASSQFIFAPTVIRYVEFPRRNPLISLRRVLDLQVHNAKENPFAELDALYYIILHPPDTDLELLRRLLHTLLHFQNLATYTNKDHPEFLDEFFDLLPGTAEMIFCDLHAVLSISNNHKPDNSSPISEPEPDNDENLPRKVRFHHRSLEDYLRSPVRSGDMFQYEWVDIASQCTQHLARAASSGFCRYEAKTWILDCACYCWEQYMKGSMRASAVLPSDILQFHPARIIQTIFVEGFDRWDIGIVFDCLQSVQETLHDRYCNSGDGCLLLCVRLRFIRQNADPIINGFSALAMQPPERQTRARRIGLLKRLNEFLLPSEETTRNLFFTPYDDPTTGFLERVEIELAKQQGPLTSTSLGPTNLRVPHDEPENRNPGDRQVSTGRSASGSAQPVPRESISTGQDEKRGRTSKSRFSKLWSRFTPSS